MTRWMNISLVLFLACGSLDVSAGDRERAKRIHERLTGVTPSNEMLDRMEREITVNNDPVNAAMMAIDGAQVDGGFPAIPGTGNFYNVTLKNWATPWTNGSFTQFAPLNDYTATVIGMVRDNKDFKTLLSDDILYVGNVSGIPAYSNSDNDHYEFLEASAADMGDVNVLQETTQSATTLIAPAGIAGVMSTRAAARAFFIDGTNRAMFRYTLVNHLCMDLEQVKDTSRPSDRIRQDVSRSPGLDSTLFLNQCIGCHSGMDPLAQAFAYHQYVYPSEVDEPNLSQEQREELGQMVYTPGVVQTKYLHNENNFIQGYVTPNDHWTNYWRLGDNNDRIGWLNTATNSSSIDLAIDPAYSEGDGPATMGAELANSEAFASCQVRKAFETVCRSEPAESDRAKFGDFTDIVKNTGDMKQVFAEIAAECSKHL